MSAPYNYLTLNGSNQYVDIPRSIQDDFTIEFWFRSTQGVSTSTSWWDGAGLVDGECNGYVMDLGTSLSANGVAMAGGGTGTTILSQAGLNDGNWHHFVYTRNAASGTMILYIDETQVSAGTCSTGSLNAPSRLAIGRILAGGKFFSGDIGEIRLWNTVKTLSQINQKKDCILTGNESGLVAYYKSVSGTTLVDSSGNGNVGIIYNSPTFTDNNSSAPAVPDYSPTATLVNPDNAIAIYDTTPDLTAQYDAPDSIDSTTFLIEVDITASFNSPRRQYQEFEIVATGTQKTFTPTTPLIKGFYYWRATVSNINGTGTSTVRNFRIEGVIKRAYYQYENVSKLNVWTKKRSLYQYENVAKANIWTKTRAFYQYENINSDPPYPTIFRLSAYRIAKGGSLTIYGSGFGMKQADDTENADRYQRGYGGEVYLGDKACAILSWSWGEIKIALPTNAASGGIKVVLTKPASSGDRISNILGLEVMQENEEVETGMELYICQKDAPNVVVAQAYNAKGKNFQELLNAAGAGQFEISTFAMTDDERSVIKNGNLVVCRINGTDHFKWVIENIKPTEIASGERGAEKLEVSGRGVLSILKEAIIYPLGYPTPTSLERSFSGGNAATIFLTLLMEAQARGTLKNVTWDFTTEADSLGRSWDDAFDFSFHTGTDLLQAAEKFTTGLGIFDFYMDPNLTLHAYSTRAPAFGKGVDVSDKVIFRPGQALMRLGSFYNSPDIINTALVEGKDGEIIEVSDGNSVGLYGRREGYLQSKDISGASLSLYGEAMLKNKGQIEWGHEAEVSWLYFRANKDYYLGDYIKLFVPDHGGGEQIESKVRVKGYTISADDDTNALNISLNLNNMLLEKIIALDQLQQRLALSSSDVALTSPDPEPKVSKEAFTAHNHNHGDLLHLGDDHHTQYLNSERHANTDHSFITTVSSIKKQGGEDLTGAVTLIPGTNVSMAENATNKTITISATGGSGGASYYRTIDIPPANPSTWDDEFDSETLDSKWTVWNKTSAQTVELIGSHLVMETPLGGEKRRIFAIMQTAPAGTWKVRAKCAMDCLVWDFFAVLLIARNSAGNKSLMAGIMSHSSYGCMTGYAMKVTGTEYGGAEYDLCNYVDHEFYLEMEYDGANLIWRISTTGVKFRKFFTQAVSEHLGGTPDQIGINIHPYDDTGAGWGGLASFDWFRVTTP